MAEDAALRFAERLLALLDATRYAATYKLATLLALIDVTAERTGPGGRAPATLPAKEVARRVIELYWPQTIPYGAAAHDQPRVLSQAPQNDIPAKLAAWRAAHHLPRGASLQDAGAADPGGWQDLEADLLAVVIGMPLAKLQRFGDGRHTTEDRFIYDFSWREEIGRYAVARPDFDDSLRLRPGVGGWLVRLAPLIRPLVQAKWAARVAARNSDLTGTERLDEFLFGAQRTAWSGSVGRSPRPRAATASTATVTSVPGAPSITSCHGHATPTTPSTTSPPPTPGATTPGPPAWPAWTTCTAGSPDSSPAPPQVPRSRTSQRRPDGHGGLTGSCPQPGPPTYGYRNEPGYGSTKPPTNRWTQRECAPCLHPLHEPTSDLGHGKAALSAA